MLLCCGLLGNTTKWAQILIFDFGAPGVPPKGAPKIEVHGTYLCMVSSKHPGSPLPQQFLCPLQKISSCFGTSQMAPGMMLWSTARVGVVTLSAWPRSSIDGSSSIGVSLTMHTRCKLYRRSCYGRKYSLTLCATSWMLRAKKGTGPSSVTSTDWTNSKLWRPSALKSRNAAKQCTRNWLNSTGLSTVFGASWISREKRRARWSNATGISWAR